MALRALPATGIVLALWAQSVPAFAQERRPPAPVLVAAAEKAKMPARVRAPVVQPKRSVPSIRPSSAAAVPATPAPPVRPQSKAKPGAVAAPVFVAATSVSVRPESVAMSAQRLERIGEVFRHEISLGHLPGAVVMVARRGRVVFHEAWGQLDPAAKSAMPADAIFRIYGLGQPIVAVAALMLAEDGIIQLTDPVSKYLPRMADAKVLTERGEVATQRAMSVHDLLRQTAGLSYGEWARDARLKKALSDSGMADPTQAALRIRGLSTEDMVGRLSRLPLATEPGTTWEVGFAPDLLGRVVEAAAGKPLGAFLKERLFDPLGMSDATFHVTGKSIKRLAQPLSGHALVDMVAPQGNDAAGSGLAMTAGDYVRFGQMLLNGGILDGKRVLSPATVRLMTSGHLGAGTRFAHKDPGQYLLGSPGYTFGLGVAVRTADGIASVPGSAGEYSWGSYAGSFFWVDPKEQMVVVYQTQAPTPDRERFRRLVKQLVYQAILE